MNGWLNAWCAALKGAATPKRPKPCQPEPKIEPNNIGGGIEIMRNGDTERQRDGDSDETQDTEDIPPLAASVKTLQEAVQLSLKDGLSENSLFIFSRALKAFEITTKIKLPPAELDSAFSLWWNTAQPALSADADFDEWRLDFLATFAKTRAPLGSNSLAEAIRRADANPPPPQATRYGNLEIRRLVAACYHLQVLQGSSPFILSVRDAARILRMKNFDRANLDRANNVLHGLITDGVLMLVQKGQRAGRRAARFRFNSGQ